MNGAEYRQLLGNVICFDTRYWGLLFSSYNDKLGNCVRKYLMLVIAEREIKACDVFYIPTFLLFHHLLIPQMER